MAIDKETAVDAYGRFTAEFISIGLQRAAARDWEIVKAYIDAEADRVAQSDPPVVDRTAVAIINDADSVLRMVAQDSNTMTPLESDIWDTVYRFRDKTCTAQVNAACDRYDEDRVLAAYLDEHPVDDGAGKDGGDAE